ncbi:MAG: serine hydrolase [Candidatus Levyibacteriota bacterium]
MRKYVLVGAIFLLLGIFVGVYLPKSSSPQNTILQNTDTEMRASGYKFISPLLECEPGAQEGKIAYKPSYAQLSAYINQQKQQGTITDVGLYYRDLNNGPWFAINENLPFAPASLLKIPVMIAYYKQAESDPTILQKKILFTKSINVTDQFFKPQQIMTPNVQYSIDDLITRMIVYSDNDATWLLEQHIDNSLIDQVTKDLGVATATNTTPDDYMSVRSYASLYRILYNASYLDREYSEKALQLLSQTDFPVGIGKGIPENITISDKFGERELDTGEKQLHDCGIVYYPSHPYLLCIMTRGNDYTKLSQIIEQISSKIYSDIHAKYH